MGSWRGSIISPAEEELSPKRLDYQQTYETFKSVFSPMSNLLYVRKPVNVNPGLQKLTEFRVMGSYRSIQCFLQLLFCVRTL